MISTEVGNELILLMYIYRGWWVGRLVYESFRIQICKLGIMAVFGKRDRGD